MAKDNQVLVRLNDPQFEAFKEFAEDRDYNHAEASREIIKSRLAGEGYLQREHYDSPIADGGELLDEVQEAKKEIQSQSNQIEEQKAVQTQLSLVLALAILWLGAHIVFNIESVVSIGTGIILMAGLVYSYYRYLWV